MDSRDTPRLGYCIGGKGRADGPEIRPGCLPLSSSDKDQTDNRRNVFTLKSMLPGVSLRTVFKVIMPLFTADIILLRGNLLPGYRLVPALYIKLTVGRKLYREKAG